MFAIHDTDCGFFPLFFMLTVFKWEQKIKMKMFASGKTS